MSADRKAWAELRERIGATVKPIAARAVLGFLIAAKREGIAYISTYDLRRVAHTCCGFLIPRSRKDHHIEWIDALCHWIKSYLRDLPADERRLIDDIFADAFAPDFWARLTEAAFLISEVRIILRAAPDEAAATVPRLASQA